MSSDAIICHTFAFRFVVISGAHISSPTSYLKAPDSCAFGTKAVITVAPIGNIRDEDKRLTFASGKRTRLSRNSIGQTNEVLGSFTKKLSLKYFLLAQNHQF